MKSNLSNTGDIEKNNENGKFECVGRKESQEMVNEGRNVAPDTNMNDIINAKGAIGSQTGSIDKEIIKLIFEIGELSNNIGLDTAFDEIELDSIEFITIIVEVETNYEIEFDDENMLINNYRSIGDFVEYVKKKITKAK
ncbi:acyl carrier protein [Eubacterium sp.]|uniref:acyl carrier protein n=1 Tax=Eubacterium sp. TaxID=142586 RepID=UPI003521628B